MDKVAPAQNADPCLLADEALLVLVRSGKREYFQEIVKRHSDRLVLIIRRMVQSDSQAEDILQDTWVRVLQSLRKYDSSRPLSPWLISIAMNRCRDHLRQERLRRWWRHTFTGEQTPSMDDIESPRRGTTDAEELDISRALSHLSLKLREVVVLKFYSGLTQEEIARVLNVPTGTVKSRLHGALGRLRDYFDERRGQS